MSGLATLPLPRVVTGTALGNRILESYHQHVWPADLARFRMFTRDREKGRSLFRPVVWDAAARALYVLRIVSTKPEGIGHWERWQIDGPDEPLSDVTLVSDMVTPEHIAKLRMPIRPSSVVDMPRRQAIVQAFCQVEIEIAGKLHRIFNPFVMSDKAERSAALRHVYEALGQPGSYQTYILKLFHVYVHNGAGPRAVALRTDLRGGPGVYRVGKNNERPGRKTLEEKRSEKRAKVLGEEPIGRRGPVTLLDIEKFTVALQEFHIDGKQSLTSTYASMLAKHYRRYPRHLIPREQQFNTHARERLLEKTDAHRKRIGPRLAAQYDTARTGQATRMTFGMNLEVVDIDGFDAKIPVAAIIDGKVEAVIVTIIFAVSRRSGAVVGYEFAMENENAESFRRCIASIYVPKEKRARELGLEDTRGLLHGSIEAIFVDNGAGKASDVRASCDEMRLKQFYAPPERGDLKATGESLNNTMVNLLSDLVGGYTRKRDVFSRELRRIKEKDKPITLEQLETFLLIAIQHVNLYANKRHLRSETMRKTKRVSIHPASLWRWYQDERVADQRVDLTEEEAWERFIPWRNGHVRGGKLEYLNKSWRSNALAQLYNEHRRKAAKNKPLIIEYKRVGSHATRLLWRFTDGRGGELSLTEHDAEMLGVMTWNELGWRNADDLVLDDKNRVKKATSRGRLTVKQQTKADAAERRRVDSPETDFEGANLKAARQNASIRRDAKRFNAAQDEQRNTDAAFRAVEAEVFRASTTDAVTPATDDAYDDDFAARLLAMTRSPKKSGSADGV